MGSADDRQAEIEQALDAFVGAASNRSAGVQVLRGASLTVTRGEHEAYPAASIVKIPLAMALYDRASRGELSLDARIRNDALGETVYSSVLTAFDAAHEFSLQELCGLMLITSDNPASSHILRTVGTAAVNDTLRRLGAADSNLDLGFGDDVVGGEGRSNLTTLGDMLTILRELYAEPRYSRIVLTMKNNVRNTRIPLRLPDTLPIAHKTGSLEGVAHDAGILYGQDVDVAMVFLAKDEKDPAAISVEMGDCAARVWEALGEYVE
jgi:beta-lactamase class A